MSQQINLLLPALRPRRNWLALPVVLGLALAGVAAVGAVAAWERYQVHTLSQHQLQADTEIRALQQQIQAFGQTLASRKPNAALVAEIDRLNEFLQQREAALRLVEAGQLPAGAAGHSSLMRGFARQALDGVWLTGFSFAGDEAEIHGRLTDPSLLPQYIRRLNGEPVFQGRRFATLDMKEGGAGGTGAAPGAAPAAAAPRYTDFTLHSKFGGAGEVKP